jgi:hypothetical protein
MQLMSLGFGLNGEMIIFVVTKLEMVFLEMIIFVVNWRRRQTMSVETMAGTMDSELAQWMSQIC